MKSWEESLQARLPSQRMLACCAAAALRSVDPAWSWEAEADVLDSIERELPALQSYVHRLRQTREQPEEPSRWFYEALPFHMR